MISVLLPTMGRPDRAAECVDRLLATTRGHEVEVVAVVDADEATCARLSDRGCVVDYDTQPRGSESWNIALSLSRGDPVVLAADDLVWGDGWLDAALACLAENPGCLIGFNDGHMGAELSTHYLMERSFVREVLGGRIAWGYQHSFTDLETCERAKRAGRYCWCPDAYVFHRHWLFGDRERDATDERLLGVHHEAQALYSEREAAGFPDDLPAVI